MEEIPSEKGSRGLGTCCNDFRLLRFGGGRAAELTCGDKGAPVLGGQGSLMLSCWGEVPPHRLGGRAWSPPLLPSPFPQLHLREDTGS